MALLRLSYTIIAVIYASSLVIGSNAQPRKDSKDYAPPKFVNETASPQVNKTQASAKGPWPSLGAASGTEDIQSVAIVTGVVIGSLACMALAGLLIMLWSRSSSTKENTGGKCSETSDENQSKREKDSSGRSTDTSSDPIPYASSGMTQGHESNQIIISMGLLHQISFSLEAANDSSKVKDTQHSNSSLHSLSRDFLKPEASRFMEQQGGKVSLKSSVATTMCTSSIQLQQTNGLNLKQGWTTGKYALISLPSVSGMAGSPSKFRLKIAAAGSSLSSIMSPPKFTDKPVALVALQPGESVCWVKAGSFQSSATTHEPIAASSRTVVEGIKKTETQMSRTSEQGSKCVECELPTETTLVDSRRCTKRSTADSEITAKSDCPSNISSIGWDQSGMLLPFPPALSYNPNEPLIPS